VFAFSCYLCLWLVVTMSLVCRHKDVGFVQVPLIPTSQLSIYWCYEYNLLIYLYCHIILFGLLIAFQAAVMNSYIKCYFVLSIE